MRICVLGAGAVGALIAARLARVGHDVSVLARGATLSGIQAHGLRVIEQDQAGVELTWTTRVRAAADAAAFGPQDLVVVAVKAPALRTAVAGIAPLLEAGTMVLPTMNGVPWWFVDAAEGPLRGMRLASVDPHGEIAAALPVERVLGAVVHWASSCPQPGVVRLNFGNRLLIGEPRGGRSERLDAVAAALRDAGFDAEASNDVRREVWYKLWGNMTLNPLSAVTGATADRMLSDPLLVRFCADCMREAATVGDRIGCPVGYSPEDRLEVARKLGAFKTSMLQDVEARRAVELDTLVAAVHEIAQRVQVPTPNIDALLGIARVHAKVHGLYPE